jgi:hypothetical protein
MVQCFVLVLPTLQKGQQGKPYVCTYVCYGTVYMSITNVFKRELSTLTSPIHCISILTNRPIYHVTNHLNKFASALRFHIRFKISKNYTYFLQFLEFMAPDVAKTVCTQEAETQKI